MRIAGESGFQILLQPSASIILCSLSWQEQRDSQLPIFTASQFVARGALDVALFERDKILSYRQASDSPLNAAVCLLAFFKMRSL